MEFSPTNHIVRLCIMGMSKEEGNAEEAGDIFLQAWIESSNGFEKFLAAYYVARTQKNITDKLRWLETSLQAALQVNDTAVKSALPNLYANIAQCCRDLNEHDKAKKYDGLAASFQGQPADDGPFYHGTRADLRVGDFLTPGNRSNYQEDIIMNHIYFTAIANGAGLAAALAKGDGPQRVYIVEPTGSFENDPNVTDKKFPGNLTRSYRTHTALKILGEITDWTKQTNEHLQEWREKLAAGKGKIIN